VRIFRSDDGAEIREDDLRVLARDEPNISIFVDAQVRVLSALHPVASASPSPDPKTCGAKLWAARLGWTADQPTHVDGLACVLPAGHHPFVAEGSGGSWPSRTCLTCDNLPANPLHSPGHMTAPKCWHESMPAGGSFRVSLETEVNTKP
jgi:hypothetical protein